MLYFRHVPLSLNKKIRIQKSGKIVRKLLLSLGLLLLCFQVMAQSNKNVLAIQAVLDQQVSDWNEGKIDAFMHGYWVSDSLMFVGKSGVTYGYKATYENYLKRYPDRATMGKLKFDIISLTFPSENVAFVVGKFHLTRPEKGDASGYYTLLWKKIKGKWLIVCDHTSS